MVSAIPIIADRVERCARKTWTDVLVQPEDTFMLAWARSQSRIWRGVRRADRKAQKRYQRIMGGGAFAEHGHWMESPFQSDLMLRFTIDSHYAITVALYRELEPPWYRQVVVRVLRAVTAAVRSFTRRPRNHG